MATFNTNTDLSTRDHQMHAAGEIAKAQLWTLTNLIRTFTTRIQPNPEREIAKAARREAARRRVDNLLR